MRHYSSDFLILNSNGRKKKLVYFVRGSKTNKQSLATNSNFSISLWGGRESASSTSIIV